MIDASVYAGNAAAMWTSLTPAVRESAGVFRADLPTAVRVVVREPGAGAPVGELLAGVPPDRTAAVEDPYGATAAGDVGPATQVLHMPVMVRAAGRLAATVPDGVTVARVTDGDGLAEAERVVVDGFPLPAHQPYVPGTALPPRVLDLPGWSVWLACRAGRPAAAVCTYDDGRTLGVYWLATLPGHRSAGLGRALMTAAVAAGPDRPSTLVATAAGRPLYESLGFATVSLAHWYIRPRG